MSMQWVSLKGYKIESNCYTWTHLCVLGVRVGAELKVGQVQVGRVMGKYLFLRQGAGGWGLEETEKEHVNYTEVSCWMCC